MLKETDLRPCAPSKRDLIPVKRDLMYVKRDLMYVKRDLMYVKRDLLEALRTRHDAGRCARAQQAHGFLLNPKPYLNPTP